MEDEKPTYKNVNEWIVEGWLSKYPPKEGISTKGNSWMSTSISIYAGKDSEGKTKNDYVSFFVPQEWQERFRSLTGKQAKIRLKGKPEVDTYMSKKDGELKASLSMNLGFEDAIQVVYEKDSDYSDEPF